MILVTSDEIPGKRIVKTLGLVKGNTVRSRSIGHDIMAFIRSMIGGEVTDYTKMMAESREQAVDRMVEEAHHMGANAVTAVRFTMATILQGGSEMLAYGTAVVIEDE